MQPSDYVWPFHLTDSSRWISTRNEAIVSDQRLDPIDGGVQSTIFAIAVESTDDPDWYRAGWCSVHLPNFADGGLGNSPVIEFLNLPLALNQAKIIQTPDPGYVGSAKMYYSIAFVRWLRSATVRVWEFSP
jgi:hypothetical protein